jgi:hypothetical protein
MKRKNQSHTSFFIKVTERTRAISPNTGRGLKGSFEQAVDSLSLSVFVNVHQSSRLGKHKIAITALNR